MWRQEKETKTQKPENKSPGSPKTGAPKAPKSPKKRREGEKAEEDRRTGKRVVGALARVGEGDFHDKLVTTSELRRKWWDIASFNCVDRRRTCNIVVGEGG